MAAPAARDHVALVALIEERMRTPLTWGKRANDCVSFAGAAALAQTGEDFLKALPDWNTQRGAVRVLKALGGLEAAVDGVLSPVPLAMAQRGDIGLVEIDGVASLMVIEGETLVGPGDAGQVRRPRSDLRKAWSLDR